VRCFAFGRSFLHTACGRFVAWGGCVRCEHRNGLQRCATSCAVFSMPSLFVLLRQEKPSSDRATIPCPRPLHLSLMECCGGAGLRRPSVTRNEPFGFVTFSPIEQRVARSAYPANVLSPNISIYLPFYANAHCARLIFSATNSIPRTPREIGWGIFGWRA
jgi:hypothetical protein